MSAEKNEAALCEEFAGLILSALSCYVPSEIKSFESLFRMLMELAMTRSFNLIIDEFQEFFNINASVFSDMRKIWNEIVNLLMTLLVLAWVGLLVIIDTFVEPMWDRKKRQQRNYDHKLFMEKVACIKTNVLFKYKVETRLLTLDDM